jgi:hypothetical protein
MSTDTVDGHPLLRYHLLGVLCWLYHPRIRAPAIHSFSYIYYSYSNNFL